MSDIQSRAAQKVLLCDLPHELLVKVLLNLDGLSLLRVRQTGVRLCKLIKEEMVLQYSLELSIAGMEDGPENAPFTTEERMARLKEYASSWERLRFHDPETCKVRHPNLWGVTGGLLYYGEIDVQKRTTTLVFRKLPSRTRCIEGWIRTHEVPVRALLFTADLSQDLFVFAYKRPSSASYSVTLRIAFNHISTGRSHMDANRPFIDHAIPFEANETTIFDVGICANFVTISCKHLVQDDAQHLENGGYRYPETFIFVYDWHTGALTFRIQGHIQDFAFLSHKHVLLIATPQTTPCACMLVVVNLNNQPTPDRCYVAKTLLLPKFLPGSRIPDVLAHSLSRFAPVGGFAASDRVPFRTTPESRLVTITFRSTHGNPLIFCVPLSTISPFMNSESREVSELSECMDHGIPWEDWGEKGSSIITMAGIPDVCFTWGNRCAFLSARIRARYIMVCDFNPLALKRRMGTTEVQLRGGPSQRFPLLVLDPNTESKGETFVDDVTTSLPYWMGNAGRLHAQEVIILEDHLVFVTDRSWDDGGGGGGGDDDNDNDCYWFEIYQ
ncbi:hypothetical protein BD410DRAFT_789980, partial [Rickenella mellea]